jgi:hypothetical protein
MTPSSRSPCRCCSLGGVGGFAAEAQVLAHPEPQPELDRCGPSSRIFGNASCKTGSVSAVAAARTPTRHRSDRSALSSGDKAVDPSPHAASTRLARSIADRLELFLAQRQHGSICDLGPQATASGSGDTNGGELKVKIDCGFVGRVVARDLLSQDPQPRDLWPCCISNPAGRLRS